MGVYNTNGSWNVTLVGQNDPPHSLYAPNGSFRVTQDAGQGLYAPNGSYRIGTDLTRGYYTQSGAINGILVGTQFFHAPLWISGAPELVTNGTFNTDLSGWDVSASTAPSTIVWSAGQAVTSTDGVANARFRQTVTGLVVGKLYSLSRTGNLVTFLGTTIGMAEILPGSLTATRYFIAPTTTVYIGATSNVSGQTLDNVSIKRLT